MSASSHCSPRLENSQPFSPHPSTPVAAESDHFAPNYKLQIAQLQIMRFSDEFESRFAEMLTHYPTKRSVLVPTLLYAQDEVGYLSDEVVAELANRLELTELDVRNVISYYSMLVTHPRGKYNVQVCTNIACMLRGGEEILTHCKNRLGIEHKGTTPDGLFSLEEVECIGACSWAPAVQVNYDFHENLTIEKMDGVLDEYKRQGTQ
jgi:NADH-quinone oxidoreductase subunit E